MFGNIDIVHQVYYDYNIDKNELDVYVIYDHNNFKHAFHVIFQAYTKLEDTFPNIDMDLAVDKPYQTNEIQLTPALSR